MVHLENISRCYGLAGRPVQALRDIGVFIPAGQFVAIVGPSGSGKSTLLNILGCLDRPSGGTYRLDGIDVSTFDDAQASEFRNRRIGFVFQSFHLLPRLTVLENILVPRRFLRSDIGDLDERARQLADRVGLGRHLEHRPDQLSGGQAQRVAVARALVMHPSLLLADEPTGNLDSKSAAEVLALFKEVHAAGQTVVLVTHDPDIAAHAQRQIHVRDGKIESDHAG